MTIFFFNDYTWAQKNYFLQLKTKNKISAIKSHFFCTHTNTLTQSKKNEKVELKEIFWEDQKAGRLKTLPSVGGRNKFWTSSKTLCASGFNGEGGQQSKIVSQ